MISEPIDRQPDSAQLVRTAPNLAPPPGNPRFALFDGLRAMAALVVFAGHVLGDMPTRSAAHGQLQLLALLLARQGVAIFFLISGFLLYRPFTAANRDGRPLGLGGYARRRVLRIVPAYWLALSVLIATGLVYGVTVHNWWRFYAFLQIYSPSTNLGKGLTPAWSLCVEVVFYIALPALAWLAVMGRRRGLHVRRDLLMLTALGLASLVIRALDSPAIHPGTTSLPGDTFVYYVSVPTYITDLFFWFALGMGLAVLSVALERPAAGATGRGARLARRLGRHAGAWWVAAVASFVALYEISEHNGVLGVMASSTLVHVLMGIASLCLLVPAVFGERVRTLPARVLALRGLAWIGLISYGFYLYHLPLIQWLDGRIGPHLTVPGYVALVVGSFVLTCAAAALSYYLLERPLLRRARRGQPAGSPSRGAAAMAAAAPREG